MVYLATWLTTDLSLYANVLVLNSTHSFIAIFIGHNRGVDPLQEVADWLTFKNLELMLDALNLCQSRVLSLVFPQPLRKTFSLAYVLPFLASAEEGSLIATIFSVIEKENCITVWEIHLLDVWCFFFSIKWLLLYCWNSYNRDENNVKMALAN